mmetsp:Transcript_37868/g.87950  ORF Transcript_37868/g.87950 Transcript_37868/m.87950 type:complete len:229 (-) Transcript_37868:845-1531(-)
MRPVNDCAPLLIFSKELEETCMHVVDCQHVVCCRKTFQAVSVVALAKWMGVSTRTTSRMFFAMAVTTPTTISVAVQSLPLKRLWWASSMVILPMDGWKEMLPMTGTPSTVTPHPMSPNATLCSTTRGWKPLKVVGAWLCFSSVGLSSSGFVPEVLDLSCSPSVKTSPRDWMWLMRYSTFESCAFDGLFFSMFAWMPVNERFSSSNSLPKLLTKRHKLIFTRTVFARTM